MATAITGTLTDKNKEVLDKLAKDNKSNELKQRQEMGKEQFLHLITEQLKNQDPLAPMQDQQFIAQMAQLQSLDSSNSLVDLAKANFAMTSDIVTNLKTMNESIKVLVEKMTGTKPATGTTTGTGTAGTGTTTTPAPTLSTDAQTIVNELVKMNKAMEEYFKK
jgi:flagellar basal-body rod modification protein FlgD